MGFCGRNKLNPCKRGYGALRTSLRVYNRTYIVTNRKKFAELERWSNEKVLQQVVRRIVAMAQPRRVILFGSYGRGDADEGSDLDLMVVLPDVSDKYGEIIRLHKAVGDVGVGVDVLVYSEAEYQRRSQVPGTVLYWARKEGRRLYEAAH